MSKIITRYVEIENCGECENHVMCCCEITPDKAMGTPWKEIPECPDIPSWCPLPDKEVKENK